MNDRERVIKGLEKCKRNECDDCTEKGASQAPWDCPAYDDFVDSALALLKAQEPIKPTINEYGEAYCICGENVGIIPSSKNLPSIRSKYCPECGRRMEWKYD